MEVFGPQSHTAPQPIQGSNIVEPQQIAPVPAVQGPSESSTQVQPVAESGKGSLINISV